MTGTPDYGRNTSRVVALLARIRAMTPEQAKATAAAWSARTAEWAAAWSAALDAAEGAAFWDAWYAAIDAAEGAAFWDARAASGAAACAMVVAERLTLDQFAILVGPLAEAIGPIDQPTTTN